MASEFNAIKYIDKPLLFIWLGLAIFGCMNIYSASITPDQTSIFSLDSSSGKQIIWICVSLTVGFFILFINSNIFNQLAYFLYWPMILLLIATIFLSKDVKGSHSWLNLGPIQIQPAEFAKYVTALALAKCMSEYQFQLKGWNNYIKVIGLILLPMAIIVLEKETGSALVFVSFVLLLYREGLPGLIPVLAIIAAFLFIITLRFSDIAMFSLPGSSLGVFLALLTIAIIEIILVIHYTKDKTSTLYITGAIVLSLIVHWILRLCGILLNINYFLMGAEAASAIYLTIIAITQWRKKYFWIAIFVIAGIMLSLSTGYMFNKVLQPHQQQRIKVVLGIVDDPKGIGYNTNQARIAIGSGGIFGKGYMNGTQTRLKYVPEQHTDFIFCTIGEEWGFLGSLLVVIAYAALMWRILVIAERQEERFPRCYAYGVLGIILFHFTINIGMVIGLIPVIGIPLPFLSYGGSAFLAFTLLMATLLKLDTMREERLR